MYMPKRYPEGGAAVRRFLDRNRAPLAKLAAHLRAHPPRSVTTCARGSSDHAATFGKYVIETLLGVPTSSAALSVSSIYAAEVVADDSLCIAISQSGRSPDLLTAVEAHKRAGAHIVALVNDEESPLAALADTLLPLCAGPERSVAATKSLHHSRSPDWRPSSRPGPGTTPCRTRSTPSPGPTRKGLRARLDAGACRC